MIGAIVLAAGLSRRMGLNKLLLPFGSSTAVEIIVREIIGADRVQDLVVVTGHDRERIESTFARYPVRCVFNYVVVENDGVLHDMDTPEDYDVLVHRSARRTRADAGAQKH